MVLVGCGARTGLPLNEVAAGDGSLSSDSGATNEDSGSVGPGVTCSLGTTGVSGGGGSCEVKSVETCSNGTTYAVECSCPAATCICSESSGQGGSSGGGIPFTGCTGTCVFPSSLNLAYESAAFHIEHAPTREARS